MAASNSTPDASLGDIRTQLASLAISSTIAVAQIALRYRILARDSDTVTVARVLRIGDGSSVGLRISLGTVVVAMLGLALRRPRQVLNAHGWLLAACLMLSQFALGMRGGDHVPRGLWYFFEAQDLALGASYAVVAANVVGLLSLSLRRSA